MIDTLAMADELAKDGVFSRDQAERLARVSTVGATENLVTKADLQNAKGDLENALQVAKAELEAVIHKTTKETIKWFAGIMVTHGVAVIAVTVALVKLLA